MKTCLRLKKDGKAVFTNRVKFLKILEAYEEDCNNIREVRMLAKGADEISWATEKINAKGEGVITFLYEEDRDFPEEKREYEADNSAMHIIQIFFEEGMK